MAAMNGPMAATSIHAISPCGHLASVGGLVAGGIAVVAMAIVFGAILVMLRRRVLRSGQEPQEPFTLEQLRLLRDAGQMSQEEYERARELLVARFSAQAPERLRGDASPDTAEK